MRFSAFRAQSTALRYRSRNSLAGFNLNIAVNTRKYFSLTDFRAALYLEGINGISPSPSVINLFFCDKILATK
jgi:hypothetical protein